MDISRKANLEYLEEDSPEPVIAYAAGNALVILFVPSMKRRYVFGIDRTGVGSFAVHPTRKSFTVGEKGKDPKLCVYEYPSLDLIKILRNGAVRSYACMSYSSGGGKLATVSGSPDFMLSIWDWNNEQMLLQSKAFGQEVYSVKFSTANDGRLTTAGTGHIRFWKMASTFTGLKLQGDIGKFGKVELTDIHSFVELPTNQILSSTESGSLLLWEGHFIKCRIMRSSARPCHDGEVTFLALADDTNSVVSAGADGWVRYWDTKSIVDADIDTDVSIDHVLEPRFEFRITNPEVGCSVRWMLHGAANGSHYFIRDSYGKLWKLLVPGADANQLSATCLTTFHAGPIESLAVSSIDHFAATAGFDGTVRCWDYIARRQLYLSAHAHAVTSLCWAPAFLDSQCRTLMVGFDNGVVRVLYRAETQWLCIQCFKPHDASITKVAASPDGKYLATGCAHGIIFLLQTHKLDLGKSQLPYEPVGFVNVGGPVSSLCWQSDSLKLLIAANGRLMNIDCSGQLGVKGSGTYELCCPVHELHIPWRHEDTATSDIDDAQNSDSAIRVLEAETPVSCAAYFENNTILTAFTTRSGLIHVIEGGTHDLVESLPVGMNAAKPNAAVIFVNYEIHLSLVVTTSDDGTISLRQVDPNLHSERFCVVSQPHDADACVNGAFVSYDGLFVLSVGSDGLFVIQQLKLKELKSQACNKDAENRKGIDNFAPHEFVLSEVEPPSTCDGFDVARSDISSDIHDRTKESAHLQATDLPDSAYSFEDSRAKQQRDEVWAAAEKRKEAVRNEIAHIRDKFENIVPKIQKKDTELQLHDTQDNGLVIDLEFNRIWKQQEDELLEQVRQSCQYNSQYSKLLLGKLRGRYLTELQRMGPSLMEGQTIMALLSRQKVGSFRLAQVNRDMRLLLLQLHSNLRYEEQPEAERIATNGLMPRDEAKTAEPESTSVVCGGNDKRPSTLEARKLMRLNRQAKLVAIAARRPLADTDDSRDVEAIKQAKVQLGGYKMKSDPSYEIARTQQISTAQKRRQMLLLQENIDSIKLRYNKRFLALRAVKRLMIHSLRNGIDQAREVSRALGLEASSLVIDEFEPALTLDEWPDVVRGLSKNELDSFLSGDITETSSKPYSKSNGSPLGNVIAARSVRSAVNLPVFRLLDNEALRSTDSCLQKEEDLISCNYLRHQRSFILHKIDKHVFAFENALNELRKEYIPLQADLKAAVMKLTIMLQELLLLKTHEARDVAIKANLNLACQKQHNALTASSDSFSLLAAKKNSQNKCQTHGKAILSEFLNAAPKHHQFHKLLFKVFNKKLKRSRKNISGNTSEDETNEEGEDSEPEEEDDRSDSEEDDTCPAGCNTSLYEQVIELRERRLDQEDILADNKCAINGAQKAYDRHVQQEKQMQRDVCSYVEDTFSFQTKKQQTLNKLYSPIALHMNQLYVFSLRSVGNDKIIVTHYPKAEMNVPSELVPSELAIAPFAEMGNSVLFSRPCLGKLHTRIFVLKSINKREKTHFSELHRIKRRLERAKGTLEAETSKLRSKCTDLQMLQFGQLINLDILGRDSRINEDQQATNGKLRKMDTVNTGQLNKLKRLQSLLHDELRSVTCQNTTYLTQVATSSARQFQLEKDLDFSKSSANDAMNKKDSGALSYSEVEERSRLVALVKIQAKEIDAIKLEINLLRRKGGHVYAYSASHDATGVP